MRRAAAAAAALLVLLLAGCGGDGPAETEPPPPPSGTGYFVGSAEGIGASIKRALFGGASKRSAGAARKSSAKRTAKKR